MSIRYVLKEVKSDNKAGLKCPACEELFLVSHKIGKFFWNFCHLCGYQEKGRCNES
jgi:ribosomal protein L37AE/L43A